MIGLYADFNTLPLPELHKQQLLLFMFKVMRQPYTLPSVFKNYFNINSNVHTHATRSRNNIHMNRQSTTYGQRCLKYKGACLWNNLPEYIKNQASFNELKAMLRQHLVNEHCWRLLLVILFKLNFLYICISMYYMNLPSVLTVNCLLLCCFTYFQCEHQY